MQKKSEDNNFRFCWTKNSVIYLRNSKDSQQLIFDNKVIWTSFQYNAEVDYDKSDKCDLIRYVYISMATAKEIAKQNRRLFQEMPFHGVNFTQSSNLFENNPNLTTKKQLDCLTSLYDLDLFNLNAPDDNSAFNQLQLVRCKYYSPHSFDQLKNKQR